MSVTSPFAEAYPTLAPWQYLIKEIELGPKVPVRLSYIICSTPRTGSTLLCRWLLASRVAGFPTEWALPLSAKIFENAPEFNERAYILDIVRRTTTPNGVFGIKLMWQEMEKLLRSELWPQPLRARRWNFRPFSRSAQFEELFPHPRYVYISRADKVKQAVSLLIAVKSDQWHQMSDQDTARGRRWPVAAVEAELRDSNHRRALMQQIARLTSEIGRQEREWQRFFAREKIDCHRVIYEQLAADPADITNGVLRFLGLSCPSEFESSGRMLRALSDERNALLLASYRAHTA